MTAQSLRQKIAVMRTTKKMKNSSPTVNAAAAVDRISELPDEIIHLILGSLHPHELAARTSILSRRWLHLWRSYPEVEFHHLQKIFLYRFAVATSKRLLLHQRESPLLLDSFTIILASWKNNYPGFRELLSSASLTGDDGGGSRSPLKVVLRHENSNCNGFPEGGMFLNCGRTKFLHLQGFDLIGLRKTCLDNLQDLHLQQVCLCEQSFQICLANAPRLEKLKLVSVEGIRSLDISASNFPSLKTLFVLVHRNREEDELMQLKITSAPFLHTLDFKGHCKLPTALSSSSAPNLAFAKLRPNGETSRREVEDLISKLPFLESLNLDVKFIRCKDGARISARELRKLTIKQYGPNIELEIDAPNLVTLTVKTSELPINLNAVNVAPTCQCLVDCWLRYRSYGTGWLIELRRCLEALATRLHELVFKLDFDRFEKASAMDLSRVQCVSSPLMVEHLQLATNLPLGPGDVEKRDDEIHLLDGLLWTCHPKMLSIARVPYSRHNRSLFSYIRERIKKKNLRNCCSNGRCWRHQFKDAKMRSVIADDRSTVDHTSITSQPSMYMIFILSKA